MGYTRESLWCELMGAFGCFWEFPLGNQPITEPFHLGKQTSKKKKKILLFWAELLSTLTKWLPTLPLPLLMIWLFPLPKLIRKLLLYAQELAIFCSSLPTFRKICDFNFLCIHIFLFLFSDLGPKSTADVFCYMYHLSEAIFRHFLVLFHFKNFPNICYVLFFFASHSGLICWQAKLFIPIDTAHTNSFLSEFPSPPPRSFLSQF